MFFWPEADYSHLNTLQLVTYCTLHTGCLKNGDMCSLNHTHKFAIDKGSEIWSAVSKCPETC